MALPNQDFSGVHHESISRHNSKELMDSPGQEETTEYTLSHSDGDNKEKRKELEDKVSNLKQQVLELQSQNECLSQEVQDLKDKIDKLIDELKGKEQSIKSLEKQAEKLQAQITELQRKLAEYKCDQDELYLCQIAVEFEQAICSHVLPEVFSTTSNSKIDDLLNMLNSGDDEYVPLDPAKYDIKAILTRAKQRWEKLCDDLGLPVAWKTRTGEKKINFYHRSVPSIFRAIALLRHKRNYVAHPNPVSVQVAEKKIIEASIKKDLEEWQFQLVKDFILSL